MGLSVFLPLAFALIPPLRGADSCTLAALQGTYGFQLSGDTTITSDAKPVTALGRIIFDGDGALTGYSSVMIAGFLLGNPVTGTYDTRSDCTVSWSLQDDSGAFQHFGGVFTPDGKKIVFRQTDPGGAQNGVMERAKGDCKITDLHKSYEFTLSGSSVVMAAGQVATSLSSKGTMSADVNGNYKLTFPGKPDITDATISVESDCTMKLGISVPSGDGGATTAMNFKGMLVNDGKDILMIQTDPGWMVSGKFTAR